MDVIQTSLRCVCVCFCCLCSCCCCFFGAASSVRVCESTFASSPLNNRLHSRFRPRILGNDDALRRLHLSRNLADTSLVLLTATYNTESTELQRFCLPRRACVVWSASFKFAFGDLEVDGIGNVAPITVSVCVLVKVLELLRLLLRVHVFGASSSSSPDSWKAWWAS